MRIAKSKSLCLFVFITWLYASSLYAEDTSKRPFFEGYELLQKGFVAEAIPFFEEAIATDPNHAPTYSKLADCYEKLGDYEKAAPLWSTYVTLRPNLAARIAKHLELLTLMMQTEVILAEEKAPPLSEADAALAEVDAMMLVDGISGDGVASGEDATSSLQENAPSSDTKSDIKSVVDENLLKIAADTYRGSCIAEKAILILIPRLLSQDDYATALVQIKRVAQEFPLSMTPQMHLWWGMSLRGTGAWFEAIRVLTLTEGMFKDDPAKQKEVRRELARSHIGIAKDCMAQKKYDLARQTLLVIRSKYLSVLSPEESIFVQNVILGCEQSKVTEWIAQGDAYVNQGMYEDAIRWYSKVRSLTYSNRYTLEAEKRIRMIEQRGEEYLAQANALVLKKEYGDAMKVCESIEKAFPKDFRIRAMEAYADAALAAQQMEQAAKKLLELAERYPSEEAGIMAYSKVGYLYGITSKQPDKGLGVFQKMLSWQPNDPRCRREALLGNGIMLAILGRKEDATKILTAVAIEYKDNDRVTKLCREYIWKCKNCKDIAL